MRRWPIALAALAMPGALAAASLSVSRSVAVVADGVNLLNPKALPGADVDTSLIVTNPLANLTLPVRGVQIVDTIPATARLRVADYGAAGSGPVEFADGSLLGTGLLNSGVSYAYAGLSSTTDGLEFSDGTSWSYVPVPDADGYDGKVRQVRVTLTGTQATGGSFRLRYRARLR